MHALRAFVALSAALLASAEIYVCVLPFCFFPTHTRLGYATRRRCDLPWRRGVHRLMG